MLPGLGNRRDKLRAATGFDNSSCWLSVVIKFPVSGRILIGRIQNRFLKESIIHRGPLLTAAADNTSFFKVTSFECFFVIQFQDPPWIPWDPFSLRWQSLKLRTSTRRVDSLLSFGRLVLEQVIIADDLCRDQHDTICDALQGSNITVAELTTCRNSSSHRAQYVLNQAKYSKEPIGRGCWIFENDVMTRRCDEVYDSGRESKGSIAIASNEAKTLRLKSN